jgi:hypothetical protein
MLIYGAHEKRKTKGINAKKRGIKENWNGKRILAFVTGGWKMLGWKIVVGCGFCFCCTMSRFHGWDQVLLFFNLLPLIDLCLFFRLRQVCCCVVGWALCDLRCGCLLFSARVCC